ncbi:hypothetical protein GCM10009593_26880 [Microlunatus antarcticus]
MTGSELPPALPVLLDPDTLHAARVGTAAAAAASPKKPRRPIEREVDPVMFCSFCMRPVAGGSSLRVEGARRLEA